jgi:hypothetical protein
MQYIRVHMSKGKYTSMAGDQIRLRRRCTAAIKGATQIRYQTTIEVRRI